MTGENVTQIKNFSINIQNLTIKFDELSRPTDSNDLMLFATMINTILSNAINTYGGTNTEVHVKRDTAA